MTPFSRKQLKILTWWLPNSPVNGYDGIICDGAIRAGKTFPMSRSFVEWAMSSFEDRNFIMAGKSVGSLSRNVVDWLVPNLLEDGFKVERLHTHGNRLIIEWDGRKNTFHLFGGLDERSQALIQGITAAGVLFDEVALMPESFVNQAVGRCSVDNSKFWFNCNPDSPSHWFKLEWLDKARAKNLLHLHFLMDDNPSLAEKIKARYKRQHSGVFYKRFIEGLWVVAEGAIYDCWDEANVYGSTLPVKLGVWERADRYIAIDYGTQNACVFLDVYDTPEKIVVHREYYYSGRKTRKQKTDSQYADDLDAFVGDKDTVRAVIVDPSAASLIVELKNRGYRVKEADNDVRPGISLTASLIAQRVIMVHESCKNLIREIQGYVWDDKATQRGDEKPVKQDDHGPDALRYFCFTVWTKARLMGILDAA